MKEIAEAIKRLRTKYKLTQKQLGAEVGCTYTTISYIENNRRNPSLSLLREIADVFDCDIKITLVRR